MRGAPGHRASNSAQQFDNVQPNTCSIERITVPSPGGESFGPAADPIRRTTESHPGPRD